MDAVQYLKIKNRMTEACTISCVDCPLGHSNNKLDVSCNVLEFGESEKAVKIVENWAKKHSVKTFLSDFLQKYPNAPLDTDENPLCCPHHLGYTDITNKDCCNMDCKKCWNTELITKGVDV